MFEAPAVLFLSVFLQILCYFEMCAMVPVSAAFWILGVHNAYNPVFLLFIAVVPPYWFSYWFSTRLALVLFGSFGMLWRNKIKVASRSSTRVGFGGFWFGTIWICPYNTHVG